LEGFNPFWKVFVLKKYWWVLIAIFVVLGIVTLIPADASKPCLLGYEAHCSFTPISTIVCWVIAAAFYVVGKRKA
jgi:hypothetical protein